MKEYSKAKLCGKERILLAKMVPKYTNRNAISLVYIQMNPCQAFKYNNDDFSVVIFRRPCYNNGWFLTKCRRRTLCQIFSKCGSFTADSTTRSQHLFAGRCFVYCDGRLQIQKLQGYSRERLPSDAGRPRRKRLG